jgi:hypothetical protein
VAPPPRAMTHSNKIWVQRKHKYYSTHIKPNKCMRLNIFKPNNEKYEKVLNFDTVSDNGESTQASCNKDVSIDVPNIKESIYEALQSLPKRNKDNEVVEDIVTAVVSAIVPLLIGTNVTKP